MLVNEVALGNIKDYFQHDTTLTAPPDGYDSTHGVGRDQDNSSQFEVNVFSFWDTVHDYYFILSLKWVPLKKNEIFRSLPTLKIFFSSFHTPL